VIVLENKVKKGINAFLISLVSILVIEILRPYFLFNIYFLYFLVVLFLINYLFLKNKYWFIIYILFLISILFLRDEVEAAYSFSFAYLRIMFKYMFSNLTVFINFWGNVVLYMPLAYYAYKKIYGHAFYLLFIALLVIETSQYFLGRGVFDVVDILLNYTGILLVCIWMRYIKLWKNKKLKETKVLKKI